MNPFRYVLLCMILVMSAPLSGQVQLSSEYDSNGNGVIKADVQSPGTYTVRITFSILENTSEAAEQSIVVRGSGTILTLRKIEENQPLRFRYTYRTTMGIVDPKNVDTTFVYRLPFSTAQTRRAADLYNVNERHLGGSNTVNWRSLQFIMEQGDTVYAARKGRVVRIVDKYDPIDRENARVTMRTERNGITVEHADGTFARYEVLQRGSMMVAEGDVVYPDTPLALAGNFDNKVFQVRFDVFYRVMNTSTDPKFSENWTTTRYVDPVFATSEGGQRLVSRKSYTPVLTPDILKKEMNKRELKARKLR